MTRALFIKKIKDRRRWPLWAQRLFHYLNICAQDAGRSELSKQASAMAYVTLFSLVPSLAAVFTLLGLFLPMLGDNSNLMSEARQFLFKYLATGSGTLVIDYLEKFVTGLNLKRIGISAFLGLLLTLIILLRQIEEAFNRIWMVNQARPILTRFVYFWLFLTLGMFSVSMVIGISTSYSVTAFITQKTLAAADQADRIPLLSTAFNWGFTCLLFFLAYKVIPNCGVRNKSARVGALLAGTAFYVISKIYGFYVTSFASYKSIYGTLAALPIFLMWIYLCWIILLAGALIAWRWQNGWPPLEEEKTIEATTSSVDEHRNLAIRSLLPTISLLSVYQRFRDGKEIDVTSLVEELRLPYGWVHEAIEFLRELGLVAHARVTQADKTERDQILPTQPAETISLGQLAKLRETPISDWLETWEPNSSKALKDHITKIKAGRFDNSADALSTLLGHQPST
jgi:membrane protein